MSKNKKRRVIVGTPCYDGRVDTWYANSLVATVKQSYDENVEITPIWVSYDALIQRARNDTIFIALEKECDDLFWIDSDIEWKPDDFFKILNYPVDIVGGTYPKKCDSPEMYVGSFGEMKPGDYNLREVLALGTGFLRFSRKACQWLWDNSEPYTEMPEVSTDNIKHRKAIFNIQIKNASLVSEDIYVCNRLREEGKFKIYLDPHITCNHYGGKKYKGDFLKWYENYIKNQPKNHVSKINSTGLDYLKSFKNIYKEQS
jgi:hypothetical protein